MRTFDPLDWVHAFDDYEMYMYLRQDGNAADGIYMQMLQRELVDGAEIWSVLYDRRLTSDISQVGLDPQHPAYEDEVLRNYLAAHPTVVDDEKAYLAKWLQGHGKAEGEA
ncbi:hypothetical protein Heshes_12220 [Alicyclobacillus hesperidum]|uniref:Uncharacterized protein n=1 Tax=Alicyclobacillus hesperidum TaxID=89784 RepID=A0A1H2RN49_9BACL|nr:hypothetical protein [Alicyclobacillus hesperidum]GLV13538.1 hypothetical protein Heshes_12220 [Alicyclobacillus hesperidum]SDW20892.1 hypothetical protein SAMN04489725_10373 [Alicyclobacillus hesperidum]